MQTWTWIAAHASVIESVLTSIAIVLGGFWALRGDWRKTRAERDAEHELRLREQQQRQDRLKWDQAKLAYEINNAFLEDPDAQRALALIDCEDGSSVTIRRGDDSLKLSRHDALTALAPEPQSDEIYRELRDAFDSLCYWLGLFEHYVQSELVRFEDIEYPVSYYLRCLRDDAELHTSLRSYLERHRMTPKAAAFMDRFA